MQFIEAQDNRFTFHLHKKERSLLLELLKLFPLVNSAHHQITRHAQSPQLDEAQKLLEESLAEQREETRKHLLEMMHAKDRFVPHESGFRLTLDHAEIETLLQALNDVRVGSWIAVGSPNYGEEKDIPLNTLTLRHLWTLEVSGFFQSRILEALEGSA